MAIIALDTFTDADKNLVDHTPDSGFGSWTYSGAADDWKISGNKAKKEDNQDNTTRFCRSDLDIADDDFEIFADYTRSGADFAGERHGLYLLAHKTTAIANGEGVEVVFIRNGPSTVNLKIIRRDSAGVEQQNFLAAVNIGIGGGTSLRIGAEVSGLDVQAWTEPAGGGTRTNRGSPLTLTVDLRDGNHKRMGLTGRTESNAPRATMDDLTVTVFSIDGEVQEIVSIEVLQNGVVQIPADVRVIQQNVIFINASINTAILVNSEVSIDSSINLSQQNEIQIIASIQLLNEVAGRVFVGATVGVIQRSQVQIVSSLQSALNGQESVVISIQVDQRIAGQVSAQASTLVKHSGAIIDPIFEDNRILLIEHGAQTELPILWRD